MISPAKFYGGAREVSAAAHVIKSHQRGRVWRFNHTSVGVYSCQLPTTDETTHEPPVDGGPLYYLINDGSKDVTITRRKGGSTDTLFTLEDGKAAIILFANRDYRYTIHDYAT